MVEDRGPVQVAAAAPQDFADSDEDYADDFCDELEDFDADEDDNKSDKFNKLFTMKKSDGKKESAQKIMMDDDESEYDEEDEGEEFEFETDWGEAF